MRSISFALLVVALLPAHINAQSAQTPPPPSRAQILAGARDVMQRARYCTFITNGQDGQPQARIVDPLGPDENFTTWVATNPLTRKVAQIRRDARVTLLCFDTASQSYVTILGTAAIVTDPAERARRWKSDWAPFYPTGAAGNDFLLIRVTPKRLEVVSAERGLLGDSKTWLPLSIAFP
jgi:general stress protein 26